MAATKQNDVEREEIFIPRARFGEDSDLFMSVNGVNWLLPRGKKHMVPKFLAEEIRRCWDAQAVYEDNDAKLQEEAKKPL